MLFSNAPGRSHLHPIRFHSLVARDFHARGEEKPCCALGRATLVGFYDIYIYIHFLTSTPPLKRIRHALCSMTMMYEFKSGGVHEPMQNLSEHNSHKQST